MAIVTRRCPRCGAHGCYRDDDDNWRCLLCARVVGDSSYGKRRLDPAKVNTLMQQPPGAFLSLRAAVAESLAFDLE